MEPEPGPARIPAWRFAVRIAIVAAELILVVLLGTSGSRFFYQGF